MQLKIKRSQREAGLISKTAVFIIDARVVFTANEERNVQRYKLWNEHIYSSESAKKSWINAELSKDGSTSGGLKTLTHSILAAFKLNVTVRSIHSGQHIECKNLDELIFAEECIKTACKTLREYLDVASTFNGSEVLYEYQDGEVAVIARSIAPEPALITAPGPDQHTSNSSSDIADAEYEEYSPESDTSGPDYDQASNGQSSSDGGDWGDWLNNNLPVVAAAIGVLLLFLVIIFIATKHTDPVQITTTEQTSQGIPEGYTGAVFYKNGNMVIPETGNGIMQDPCDHGFTDAGKQGAIQFYRCNN